jgi:hypothetical protein
MHMASKALFHGASVMFGAGIVAISSMVGVSGALAQSNECGCMAAAGTAGIVQSVRGNVFVSQATGSVPAQPRMQVEAGNSVIVGPQSASVRPAHYVCTQIPSWTPDLQATSFVLRSMSRLLRLSGPAGRPSLRR